MQALTKSDEQKLFDGVKQASNLVDQERMMPDDALHKVALDLQYSPGFLKKACHAFNTGRQLAQWEANTQVMDKLASFPLADYDAIHDRIWGKTQEKAACVNYDYIPLPTYNSVFQSDLLNMPLTRLEKAAADLPPAVQEERNLNSIKRSYDHYQYAIQLENNARTEKTAAELRFNNVVNSLVEYFQKSAYDRLPFAQVEHAVSIQYGNQGRALMNLLSECLPSEKRAAEHKSSWPGFRKEANYNTAPYRWVAEAIKSASQLNSAISELAAVQAQKAEKQAAVDSMYDVIKPRAELPTELTPELIPDLKKKASMSDTASFIGLNTDAMKRLGFNVPDSELAFKRQLKRLEDPNHENELRKIKAQTSLNSLMTDPDNPLSTYDPEEVLTAYNELVQLSPRIADQPAILNPLLNKRLAGRMEPFELGETLKLESELKKTQTDPMQYAPGFNSMSNIV